MTEKSWLHWSFLVIFVPSSKIIVSMTEKSWLHWSVNMFFPIATIDYSFHDWKVMAPLKPYVFRPTCRAVILFPWLKSHGSIEAGGGLFFCTWCGLVSMTEKSWLHWSWNYISFQFNSFFSFHDWKVMAPLKLALVGLVGLVTVGFPWLKSHGSIEALLQNPQLKK